MCNLDSNNLASFWPLLGERINLLHSAKTMIVCEMAEKGGLTNIDHLISDLTLFI